ncbi:MAG: hypothetical protein ABL931_01515 [Usitatibacteraceae bacterium]
MTQLESSMTISVVSERGQISLGAEHKGKQFVVEELPSGDILLRRNSTFKAEVLAGGDAVIVRTFVDAVGKKKASSAARGAPMAVPQRLEQSPTHAGG